MQPLFILATTVVISTGSVITAGYFFVRKLTSQLEASSRLLKSALDQHKNSVNESLAEHAEVGKKFLTAIEALPDSAQIHERINAAHDGSPMLRHSHVVTFKKQ